MNRTSTRWLLGLVVPLAASTAARAADWDPARTWVFAIGCTEWKYDRKLNQPKKGRQDGNFVATLKARGVPTEQVVHLVDKKGTLAAIKEDFTGLLKKTRPGDFLIFYFQGHGSRDVTGGRSRYYFVNYDARDEDDESFLYMDFVFDLIEANFKGSHVLMAADCCCSGGMLAEARKRRPGIAWACLASVYAHNSSTGDWTFTKGLINGFTGDAVSDVNGDRKVTLGEIAHAVEMEMAYIEKQKADFLTVNGFDPAMKVADAKTKAHPDVGKIVEAQQRGKWHLAQVVDHRDDKFRVCYVEYEDDFEWVTAKRIRGLTPLQLKEGTKVVAKNDDDKWRPAVVKGSRYGLHFVHFDHDKSTTGVLDEWVPASRLKDRK